MFVKTAEIKFKVDNVQHKTEWIEDLTSKYQGYTLYSHLSNSVSQSREIRLSLDSVMRTTEIIVESTINLKIPNENLDSFVRELNKIIVFLDYRTIKLDDVTYQYLLNSKKSKRLADYDVRQKALADKGTHKLKDAFAVEENILNRQMQADENDVENMQIKDQVSYCSLNLTIYQKPVIITETIERFETVNRYKPNTIKRIGDSFLQGWELFKEVIVFIIKLWGIFVLILFSIITIIYVNRLIKKLIQSKK